MSGLQCGLPRLVDGSNLMLWSSQSRTGAIVGEERNDQESTRLEGTSEEHENDFHLTLPESGDHGWTEVFQHPRYLIHREIARGGMGAVLRAEDRDLQRPIAVKVMLARGQDAGNDRFMEEARIMGQLQHPGIAPIHEIGLAKDLPFFSMKLVEGHTLAKLLGDQDTKDEQSTKFIQVFHQVSQTLAYAHSQGVIHRDIKPANIMVGAFGEVQVMDWGLAKRLNEVRTKDTDPSAAATVDIVPDLSASTEVGRALDATAGLDDGTERDSDLTGLTRDGQVMGTLSYMSPEQAQGHVRDLNTRTDVFALGSLLCKILTGTAAYTGSSGEELLRMAADGDLDSAHQRVQICGADRELIELAIDCLQTDPENRPGDASVVASRVDEYLTGVQDRLRKAELEQAESQIKLREEQRRRQISRALAVSLIVLVIVTSGTAIVFNRIQSERAAEQREQQFEQTQRITKATRALDDAGTQLDELNQLLGDDIEARRLLSRSEIWTASVETARANWDTARQLATPSDLNHAPDLKSKLQSLDRSIRAHESDLAFALAVDAARMGTERISSGAWDPESNAMRNYQQLFKDWDIKTESVDDIALRIQQSKIRSVILSALDHWAETINYTNVPSDDELEFQERIFAIARKADPDPWRDRFRRRETWSNKQTLQELVDEADPNTQSPELLISLARQYALQYGDPLIVLKPTLLAFPDDFWLNFAAGNMTFDLEQKVGFFRSALAIRPESCPTLNQLGMAHMDSGNLEDAADCFLRSKELAPKFYYADFHLGRLAMLRGDWSDAISQFEAVLELEPAHTFSMLELAECCLHTGARDRADKLFLEARQITPDNAETWNRWGAALANTGNAEESGEVFRKAIELEPNHSHGHSNLGRFLEEEALKVSGPQRLSLVQEAMEHFRKALALDSSNMVAAIGIAKMLSAQGDLAGAETTFASAHQLAPSNVDVLEEWGIWLHTNGQYARAATRFRSALELDADHSSLHNNLAVALADMGDHQTADQHYRRALELDPNVAHYHYTYGCSLGMIGNYQEALQHYDAAIAIDSEHAQAHCNRGGMLQQFGRFDEALESYRKGHEFGSRSPDWPYPSDWWVKNSELMLELSKLEEATQKVESELTLSGELNSDMSADITYQTRNSWRAAFPLYLRANQVYEVRSTAEFASMIRLENVNFLNVSAAYSDQSGNLLQNFQVPADGVYRLVVTSPQPNQVGDFSVTVRLVE